MSVDPLSIYNAKRDFKKTREPKGVPGKDDGNLFIVQKHDATRLHYDFRLELDGVLKSWAVTKGPSLDPEDKRLAVRTEDHPMAYGGFEGTIPEGEYGGGTVMLWDKGSWESIPGKDPRKTLEEGHLHFILHGERMKGEWLLVRMKPRPKEKRENWLLRKVEDEEAGASGDLVDHAVTSVVSGRSMAEIAKGDAVWHSDKAAARKDPQQESKPSAKGGLSSPRKRGSSTATEQLSAPDLDSRIRGNDKNRARKKTSGKCPAFRPPQLATLVDSVPSGPGWIHEVKYDGYRCLIATGGGKTRAYTRTGLDWSDKFSTITAAFDDLDVPSALIDGEVVALDANGRPSFGALQDALSEEGNAPLAYFAFDLLEEDGDELADLGNVDRKARLEALLRGVGAPIHYAEHVAQGEKLFDALCGQGYEGIISKRADAPYRGRRSKSWLKVKCTCRQEFVIIGWTQSDKARGFRSLLLGVHINGELHYAGKAGTGFTMARIDELLDKMKPLERKTAPADVPKAAARGAHWVTPELVAEIAYSETTAPLGQGGVLRHPSFIGLREDKPARDVKPEKVQPVKDPEPFGIKISNPDRVIYPEAGITKGELAAYYEAMADPILYFAGDRPISLVRCPQGRAKQCFFQKHDSGSFGSEVKHVPIREKDGDTADYLYVEDGAGLIACVQMGAIEFHGWGSRVADVEKPDRMVFDLDPDEGVDFEGVKKAANVVKEELATLGLESQPMLSGGKGIHVVVPLDARANWDDVKDFASRFARALSEAKPEMFTANMKKVERKGRIFLDWLRNQRGATAVMPWTVRARERAPVAVPVSWAELEEISSPAAFTITDQPALVKRAATKAMRNWGTAKQKLPGI